ncbi:MAG TPA: PIN domain-containing protein [Candidatus Hydrogenedentes bacterium]|nr:PIN domain-containing protein [Candidatus Hydrogenedentota bacterium]
MKIADALKNVQRIFLDTAPVIYFFERHPVYFSRMEAFFHFRRNAGITIITSPVTLVECLVHPIRRGLSRQCKGYKHLILQGDNTEFWEIGAEAADRAARLRAALSITLADALQAGVALASRCDSFMTNDRQLSRIGDISVLLLDDLEQ